jgi:hypothetical protein
VAPASHGRKFSRLAIGSLQSAAVLSRRAQSLAPAIAHWQCSCQLYLEQYVPTAQDPQIIAWSDPNDLLSWEVPDIEGVRVVNIRVRNSGFKIPPLIFRLPVRMAITRGTRTCSALERRIPPFSISTGFGEPSIDYGGWRQRRPRRHQAGGTAGSWLRHYRLAQLAMFPALQVGEVKTLPTNCIA